MGIKITHKGDYSKIELFLNRLLKINYKDILEAYARKGLESLRQYTPKETGYTASCWAYNIEYEKDSIKVVYTNSHVEKHVNIAMILQYGHGTRTGGWVEGVDYINPALDPIFKEIVDRCWKEMKR